MERKSLLDDGVCALLLSHGFRCAFDRSRGRPHGENVDGDGGGGGNGRGGDGAGASSYCSATNWATDAPPPPTHWTGFNIDQSYGRGGDGRPLVPKGVYVGMTPLSDHLPVITDW